MHCYKKNNRKGTAINSRKTNRQKILTLTAKYYHPNTFPPTQPDTFAYPPSQIHSPTQTNTVMSPTTLLPMWVQVKSHSTMGFFFQFLIVLGLIELNLSLMKFCQGHLYLKKKKKSLALFWISIFLTYPCLFFVSEYRILIIFPFIWYVMLYTFSKDYDFQFFGHRCKIHLEKNSSLSEMVSKQNKIDVDNFLIIPCSNLFSKVWFTTFVQINHK